MFKRVVARFAKGKPPLTLCFWGFTKVHNKCSKITPGGSLENTQKILPEGWSPDWKILPGRTGATKIHKKYSRITPGGPGQLEITQKYSKNTPKILLEHFLAKEMLTKGAGAEGARPLCGAAEGRHHFYCQKVFQEYFWSTC